MSTTETTNNQVMLQDKLIFIPDPALPDYRIFDEIDTMLAMVRQAQAVYHSSCQHRFIIDAGWRNEQLAHDYTLHIFEEIDNWYEHRLQGRQYH